METEEEFLRERDQKAYAALSQAYPKLMAGTRLFSAGNTAIIVEGPRAGVLTKIFTRIDQGITDWKYGERLAQNEARALRLLESRMPSDFSVPKIIDDKITEDGKRLRFAFRMTKVHGEKVDWDELIDEPDQLKTQRHLYSAGVTLGRLHLIMAGITRKDLPPIIEDDDDMPRRDRVKQVSWLGDDWNRALEKLDHYLTKYASVAGVAHGDYNHNNFLVNKDLKISGVFDFASAYYSPNRLSDVADAKLTLPEEHWRHFVDGYSSQIPIPAEVLMGTEIAHEHHIIENGEKDNEAWTKSSFEIFHSRMSALSRLTGFTPPPLSVLQGGPK